MIDLSIDGVQQLKQKIEARTARIGIFGMGYVGLPLALLFEEQGFRVTGFDIDKEKVSTLNAGGSYFVRIPSTEIESARRRGFSATSDFGEISNLDVLIICVPTPLDDFHQPDLSYITNTAKAIAPHLRERQLVVLESTTYPGTTTEVLIPLLDSGNAFGLRAESAAGESGVGFYVAFSPEREDPGNDTVARRDIPKVVGGAGPGSTELAQALYGSIFNRTVPVSSPAAAEMTKLLENIYRCVNIALVNELKQLCERMGIDLFEVIEAAKTKPFGFQAFYPGPGLGGHCIPIDPFYLSWKARQFDFRTRFIELAGEVNTQMPYYIVQRVGEALNDRGKALKNSTVLVLGMAYKKDIDDLRESPSLTIIELLRRQGAVISYNDPYFPKVGRGRHFDLHMTCTPLDDLSSYDCVIIVTDHSAYDYNRIVREAQLVIDTRNATKGIRSENIVRC
ncbi:MAG TPA: nucleotide sugar dehydrogenase [Terracidiphilus sp.]|jgi:UDP-N-acetyl-D-glucosamine dehydrogenase|nr:nucleotide sugar dehydrogenase [Terracidiphilus sp.]